MTTVAMMLGAGVLVLLLVGSAVLLLGTILTMDRHVSGDPDRMDPPAGFCA